MAAHWFAKYLWTILYIPLGPVCVYLASSPHVCICCCLEGISIDRRWMETNCCAFFLLSSLAHSGLQKGSILWSPYTAIKVNTMKRNTQNLILYTGRVHPRNRHLWRTQLVTLQVWCIAWWICMCAIYIDHKYTHTHTDNTNMHGCNLSAFTHMFANTTMHMHGHSMCNQCWFRPHR